MTLSNDRPTYFFNYNEDKKNFDCFKWKEDKYEAAYTSNVGYSETEFLVWLITEKKLSNCESISTTDGITWYTQWSANSLQVTA